MKKIYEKPEMIIVTLSVKQQILIPVSDAYNSSDVSYGRGVNDYIWDDEW